EILTIQMVTIAARPPRSRSWNGWCRHRLSIKRTVRRRWTMKRSADMTTRTATARYEGTGKEGQGWISTQSGALRDQRYGFGTRFGDEPGTNPEELIAAAHAGCFTMALSFALAREGVTDGRLETTAKVSIEQEDDGFRITQSDLELSVDVPTLDE